MKKTLKRSIRIYLLKNKKAFERLSFLLAPQVISENTWSLKIRDDIAQSTIQNFTWNSLFNSFMKEIPIKSMNWFLYDRDLRHKRIKVRSGGYFLRIFSYSGNYQLFKQFHSNSDEIKESSSIIKYFSKIQVKII